MLEYVDLAQARHRPGLRMSVVAGVPSPWSEAAKGILHVKKIPCALVRMPPGENDVTDWTGQTSAPVALYEDEPPRGGWDQILFLAERLAPEPRLVPAEFESRAWLLGMCRELCGEQGLGWCRRLDGIDQGLASDGARGFPRPVAEYLAAKYGWYEGCGPEARRRVVGILRMLAARLHAQRATGSPYYLGERLGALDIYSAAFLVMFRPLPPEQCPMPAALRERFEALDDQTRAALDPILVEHRDRIYAEHLPLPVQS
jgi:glutathione S-transferase